MLNDGHWHGIEEIRLKMHLEEKQVQQIVEFLKAYNFIVTEETRKEIRLEDSARKFLTQRVNS